MTDTQLTTTVTFADLQRAHDDELDERREAYEDTLALIREEYGEDAIDRPAPEDDRLEQLQQTAEVLEETGKNLQRRQHVLERIADQYDGDTFEIRMLTGKELMDIETDLRMEANQKDIDVSVLQTKRKQLVVDAATVKAPDGVASDDDGSPQPSAEPNPLTLALYEQVERLNQAGDTGFTAPGFGDDGVGGPSGTSDRPMPAGDSSSTLASDGATTPPSGENS